MRVTGAIEPQGDGCGTDSPGHTVEEYRLALRRAEAACRKQPDEGAHQNTLGVALYRVGEYARALETLTRSEALNAKRFGEPHPIDLCYLAMVQHKLGHPAEAQEMVARLRTALASERWKDEAESRVAFREVEALLPPPECR